jgi:hypothetical protein
MKAGLAMMFGSRTIPVMNKGTPPSQTLIQSLQSITDKVIITNHWLVP